MLSIVFLLFFPACLGILSQIIRPESFDHRLLALGLLIFTIDQARMAVLDLKNIESAREKIEDIRLRYFYYTTISTIALELIGFYVASVQLGWGIILVLGSQVGFNLLANIRLQPTESVIIQDKPFSEQVTVLIADIIGLILIGFWMNAIAPVSIVLTLWTMAIAYACIKIVLSWREKNPKLF
jgi:uncharacterized membrane protein YiaA